MGWSRNYRLPCVRCKSLDSEVQLFLKMNKCVKNHEKEHGNSCQAVFALSSYFTERSEYSNKFKYSNIFGQIFIIRIGT